MRICRRVLFPNPAAHIAFILLLAAVFGGRAVEVLAQVPAASGSAGGEATFRAGTQEVLVDASVVDKKGNFQRGLTQQDFKILEDGKEQKITSFSFAGAADPNHRSKHFIALVFEQGPGVREQVMQFVDRFASPDLYLAVFSRVNGEMRLQQAFTSDAGRIKQALRTMPATDSMPNDRKTVNQAAKAGLDFTDFTFDRIGSVAKALAPIRGRKAMILFTYGLFAMRSGAELQPDGTYRRWTFQLLPPAVHLQKLAGDCNAANVSVYAFITDGKRAGVLGNYYDPPDDPAKDYGGATDLIWDLAKATGGKYSPPGDYDLAAYLGAVSASQNDYYLLGYTPSADSPSSNSVDNPCHKLKVNVDRKGLGADARDTYCTSGQPPARPLTSAQRALEARAASGAPGAIAARMQLSWFYSRPGVAVADVAMEIDPAAMKMHGKLHGEFTLLGIAYREDGRVPDTIEIDFDSLEQVSAFLKAPYHYSTQFDLAPGQYRFRMAVGSGDQAFGGTEKPLNIEPWSGQTMSISGIALGVQDYPATGATAELDSSLLEGPRRLESKGREFVPMGGNRFPPGQNGLFYFEVYEPRLAQSTPPAMRVRILDRATGEEKKDSGPMDAGGWLQAGIPVIPIALNLPASELPAGSYTLELRVTHDDGRDAVLRTADFDVQ